MENKPTYKPFWILFTAKNKCDFRIKSAKNKCHFEVYKSVVFVVIFIQVLCPFLLVQKWKPKIPLLCWPGSKRGIHLETQAGPGTQRVWTGHQAPLTQAPNQLGGRYSKRAVAFQRLFTARTPAGGKLETRERTKRPLVVIPQQDQCKTIQVLATESCQSNFCPSGTRSFPSSLLTARGSDSTTCTWENQTT